MGVWIHRLTEIDADERYGICAHCGPVSLHRDGRGGFKCSRRPGKRLRRFPEHFLSEIDGERRTATCSKCGPVTIRHAGKQLWKCGAADAASKGKGYAYAEKLPLLDAQDGKCAICDAELTPQAARLDHDHETGEVRGVLCAGCNLGIGFFKDEPERLRAAAEYLLR